jgi:lysophospholipase L1-like esterase
MQRRNSMLFTWLLASTPVLGLVAPLWFHRSGSPDVGSYSTSYFLLLVGVTLGGLGASSLAAYLSHRRSTRKPVLAFVTMVVGVVVALGLAEAALRLFANDEFASYRQWGHRKAALFAYEAAQSRTWQTPATSWSDPQAAGVTYTTDEHGMRRHLSDPAWSTAAGERIFALGGSSVFGFGLADDQTWPHRLEALLRAEGDGGSAQVINAGNNGHNSLQCLLRFYLKVLPHKPDVLLYYESNNDVGDEVYAPADTWIEEDVLFSDSLSSYLAKKHRDKNWYARTLLGYRIQLWLEESARERGRSGGRSAALTAAQAAAKVANGERYIRNVATLADMCRRAQVRLVLMTFIQDGANHLLNNEQAVDHYNDLLRALAERERIPLIDLARAFEAERDVASFFFTDHYHPSPKGAAWIASQVAQRLPALLAK